MIIQFTTVHPRFDTRIRIKQTASLAAGFPHAVNLLVQDGLGSEQGDEAAVKVLDTGRIPGGRIVRMTIGSWRMWLAVRAAAPCIAHFHDPELIPVGLALRLTGVQVIYDVHEDVPRQILSKHWLPAVFRQPVSWGMSMLEWIAGQALTAIVAATPTIAARFPAGKTVTVQNFPLVSELVSPKSIPYKERPAQFVYVGGITEHRGVREMIEAVSRVNDKSVGLSIAGRFQPADLQDAVAQTPGWKRVAYLGWSSRSQVAGLLGCVRAGLVLFHPAPNHYNAQPNKMFEYMAAGLPVIASDFRLWREIVDGAGCGLLVDPLDARAISAAMTWILENPDEAEAMGQRGRVAVEKQYNWEVESQKLIALYNRLLPERDLTAL